MYAHFIAKIQTCITKKYVYNYTCACVILPEELGGTDAQKLLKLEMHHLVADHGPLDTCSLCSVSLRPSYMAYHRKYNCDDEKAS